MLGLGDYASSDDEGNEKGQESLISEERKEELGATSYAPKSSPRNDAAHQHSPHNSHDTAVHRGLREQSERAAQAQPRLHDVETGPSVNGGSQPLEPLDSARGQTIRNLTLPTVPNFNIPPSPPGSPPLRATKKFSQFLEMKKNGIHFNEKLEASSALRNPSLLDKLCEFAGISEQEQYASALPEAFACPTKVPEWMYADQLNRLQQEATKKDGKSRAGRPLEFVPASGAKEAASPSG